VEENIQASFTLSSPKSGGREDALLEAPLSKRDLELKKREKKNGGIINSIS